MRNLTLSKKQKSGILLVVVAIISSTWLVYNTVKYVGFFNALNNLKLMLDRVDFTTTQENLNITLDLEISNPTDYGDLLLNGVSGTVYYEGENHTVVISPGGPRSGTPYQEVETNLWQLPEGYVSMVQPIQVRPYLDDHLAMKISAYSEDARVFNDYYQTTGEQDIQWHVSLRVSITTPTFLKIMELEYDFVH